MSELLVAAPLRLEALAIKAGGRSLCVTQTGMGQARSHEAASRLLEHPADALIVMGVCGGLDEACEPGDVVVANELIDGERGMGEQHAGAHNGAGAGEPAADGARIACPSAEPLAAALERHGVKVRCGPVVSVARIAHGDTRVVLRERGAIVVDMESAWLAAAARERPFAVIRVVADTPSREVTRPLLTLVGAARAAVSLSRTAAALEDVMRARGAQAVLGGG